MNEALRRLIEHGLTAVTTPDKRRGPKTRWGDGRLIALHQHVERVRSELQSERGPKPKIRDEEAVAELRKQSPKLWGRDGQASLVTRFREAHRRLKRISADLDEKMGSR
jgi:hypothetical protein